MSLRSSIRAASLATALVSGASATLSAQGTAPAKAWENTTTLYLWGASMDGTETLKGYTVTVDASFGDIAKYLKFGAMLNYLGRNEKWVVGADVIYMKLGVDHTQPDGSLRFRQWLLEANGGHRLTPWLDGLLGVRVPILDVNIEPTILSPLSGSKTWAAPIVGARATLPLSKRFTAIVRGDYGGFNLGGTNNTWQAAGYVNYGFGEKWSGTIGYRALAADYVTGTGLEEFAYDITNFGPVFAVSFRF